MPHLKLALRIQDTYRGQKANLPVEMLKVSVRSVILRFLDFIGVVGSRDGSRKLVEFDRHK